MTNVAAQAVANLPLGEGGEVPGLRSRMSNTFSRGGMLQTVVSTLPVNYSSNGSWLPIDDSLVANALGALINRADDFSVVLPKLAGTAAVSSFGALSVSSVLVGAAPVLPTVAGSTATYRNVLPGVDEIFQVRPRVLEQSFRLAASDAPTSYPQSVTLSPGFSLGAAADDGSLPILDAGGAQVAALPAPVLMDSSPDPDTNVSTVNARYQVSGAAPLYTVTTVVDRSWLTDPVRVFPVLLDPSTTFGTASDLGCYVTNPGTGTPPSDPQLCAGNTGTDNQLSYGATAYVRRIYLKFGDLTSTGSPIPLDATVSNAELIMTEKAASSPTAVLGTGVYQAAGTWDSGITWSGTTTGQPGYLSAAQDQVSVVPPGVGSTFTYSITELARAWIATSAANNGVVIKDIDESTPSNTITFYGLANTANHPQLVVTWVPRVGQEKAVGAYDHRLSDRMDLHVAYGSRNLVLNNLDDQFAAPGLPLMVRRTYNSVLAANGIAGAYGKGWSMSGGVDTGLIINRSTVTYLQPGGGREPFQRLYSQPDVTQPGAYRSKTGVNADLTQPDSTHFKLTFHSSGQVMTFAMALASATTAALTSVADRSGNTVTYTNSGSPLATTKVTDSTGQRYVTMSYTSGRVSGMAETLAAGATGARSWTYAYDGSGHLTGYTNPAGKLTTYCYTGDLITRIITPHGTGVGSTCSTGTTGVGITNIAYDTAGRVKTVSYELTSGTPNTVSFATTVPLAYSPLATSGKTTFTDANSNISTYTFDTQDRVTKVEVVITKAGGAQQTVTRTSTFNTNSDVTASVSANNFTGGTNDSSTTSTFDANNNPTKTTLPTGASVAATYAGTQAFQPDTVTDDRDVTGSGLGKTTRTYSPTIGNLSCTSKGATKVVTRRQGETVPAACGTPATVANCGPAGAAAYQGAVCETRDGLYAGGSPTLHRTLYSYNALGQLVSMTPAAAGGSRSAPPAQTYTYDGFSRVTGQTSSRSKTTSYVYDSLDRLTKITYDDGHYTAYTYDSDGNQLTQTDKTAANAVIKGVTYTYDGMNRIATEQPTGEAANSMTWDANSRLLTFTDATGTATYGYDEAGSLTSETLPGGSCTGFDENTLGTVASGCIIMGVDKSGNRQFIAYPGNLARQEWVYDTAGRATKTVGRAASSGSTPIYNINYDYSAGGKDTAHLFARDDLVAAKTTAYTYGAEARLSTAVTTNDSGGATTASETFCYDTNGNRTNYSTTAGASCPGTPTNSVDGANQLLTGTGTVGNYAYDLDGNETSSNTSLAGGAVRLQSWTDSSQNAAVTIGAGSALANAFLGASNGYLYSTKAASNAIHLQRNTPLGITQDDVSNGSTTTSQTNVRREPSGQIYAMQTGAPDRFYPIVDERGSIMFVIDAAGGIAAAYTYNSYGAQTVTNSAPFNQPFGYTGAYTNPGTGLIHLSARFYDPTLGRFTQQDPMTHPGDTHQSSPYTYAGDDPINYSDPTGLQDIGCEDLGTCDVQPEQDNPISQLETATDPDTYSSGTAQTAMHRCGAAASVTLFSTWNPIAAATSCISTFFSAFAQ